MLLLIVAHFSHHLTPALLQPLLPFIRDSFALDYTRAGWALSAYNLAYGISQLPGGWLADRLGSRLVIALGTAGVALLALLVGLAPNYLVMVILLMLLGVVGGGYHPAASPLVAASVAEKDRGRALGLHQIGGTASLFLTPLIAAALVTILNWRGTWITLAIATFAFGIVLYALLGRWQYASKTKQVTSPEYSDTTAATGRLRWLVPFLTLGIVLQVLLFSVASFIPLYVVDHLKGSKEAGAAFYALFYLAGLWAGPVGGYLADRLGKVPVMLAASFLAGPVLYLLGLVSLGWSLAVVLLIAGLLVYISMPISEAYIISHASARNRSTILGIYYFASRGGPGLTMPLIGYLSDRFGFSTSFTLVGGVILMAALVSSLFLWRSRD